MRFFACDHYTFCPSRYVLCLWICSCCAVSLIVSSKDIRQHLVGAARGECDVKTGPAQVVLLKGRKTQGVWLTILYLRS